MPLIMLALWSTVARDAPVGRFDQADFVAYFLATFVVRQLTGAWVAWQLSFEVRTGTLAMRLLRPLHPHGLLRGGEPGGDSPADDHRASGGGAGPAPGRRLAARRRTPLLWTVFLLSLLGSWLITFLANAAIGTLGALDRQLDQGHGRLAGAVHGAQRVPDPGGVLSARRPRRRWRCSPSATRSASRWRC